MPKTRTKTQLKRDRQRINHASRSDYTSLTAPVGHPAAYRTIVEFYRQQTLIDAPQRTGKHRNSAVLGVISLAGTTLWTFKLFEDVHRHHKGRIHRKLLVNALTSAHRITRGKVWEAADRAGIALTVEDLIASSPDLAASADLPSTHAVLRGLLSRPGSPAAAGTHPTEQIIQVLHAAAVMLLRWYKANLRPRASYATCLDEITLDPTSASLIDDLDSLYTAA